MLSAEADINLQDLAKTIGLDLGGPVQQELDRLVIDYCIPYCPFDTGTLAGSAYASTPGEIIYPGPYAHYLYYGEVYGPNIPIFDTNSGIPTGFFSPKGQKKYPTGRDLKYKQDINPLAGSHWFERMKADRLEDILREVKAYAAKQR